MQLKSMTGFGKSATDTDDWSHVVEVRSVNGRHLDLKWRLPVFLRAFETDWEKIVREYASRGRVEISLNLKVAKAEILGVSIDEPLALSMLGQVKALARRMRDEYVPDYGRLLSMSFLWQEASSEPDP